MIDDTVLSFPNPAIESTDPLTDILRTGAQRLLAQAIEAEVAEHLAYYEQERLPDGRKAVVRNGYLPKRAIQTGLGDVPIQVPKVRDRAGDGRKFTSSLIPPFLKRAKSVAELLPVLYLKGLSTGDFGEALEALLGKEAKGLSSSTIGDETNRRGHEFNKEVAQELKTLGYEANADVDISSIISKQDLDKNYGDVDVLAWQSDEGKIYLIECKDLYYAKTAKEIAEQLAEFKGVDRNGEPDRLKKHLQRYDLLSEKVDELSRYCGLPKEEIEIIPYIIFSNPVPILYDQSRSINHVKLAYLEMVKEKGL